MNRSLSKPLNITNSKIAIIGLGYVGLPLAIEFGKKRSVVGFDISKNRIKELKKYNDLSHEMAIEDFKQSTKLRFTDKIDDIKNCKIYIVTIPTPVNKKNEPDLNQQVKAIFSKK